MTSIPPTVQIVGRKKSGKTTLIVKLVTELVSRGYEIGTMKQTSHTHEFDRPETDSWKHRRAGSQTTIIISPDEWVCHSKMPDAGARELLMEILFGDKDLVIWEGHDESTCPKIECLAPGNSPLFSRRDGLIAVITDGNPIPDIKNFSSSDISELADWLIKEFDLRQH